MSESASIIVQVNGQGIQTSPGTAIPEFLKELGLHPDRVVVEYNGTAQTRAESALTRLSNGDQLEVVRIVAGG